jgi:hypothetical protein
VKRRSVLTWASRLVDEAVSEITEAVYGPRVLRQMVAAMEDDKMTALQATCRALMICQGAHPDELDAAWAQLKGVPLPGTWQQALDQVHQAVQRARQPV